MNYDNRRDFRRMSVETALTFRLGDSGQPQRGRTLDLSATGIRFVTDTAVREGDVLTVTLQTGDARFPPLQGEVRVLRVEPRQGGGVVVAGEMRVLG